MKETVRIVRFAVIGTLNALIIAFVVWLMMERLSFGYIISNVVAYVLAQVHNFIWCKYWVFASDGTSEFGLMKQMALFVAAFGIAYLAQFLFVVVMVEAFGANEYLAQFLGLFIYGGINFVSNRWLTFKSAPTKR